MICQIPILAAFLLIGANDSLTVLRDTYRVNFGENSPATNMRVVCKFKMTVFQTDPALGPNYFSSNTVIVSPKTPELISPFLNWTEDFASRKSKFRSEYDFATPSGFRHQRGFRSRNNFDGIYAFSYEPEKLVALQYNGRSRYAGPVLGYYQDMIGFPSDKAYELRTTPGFLKEPYRLNDVVASDFYRIAGREKVGEQECLILSRDKLDKLWLSETLGWALVKREWNWALGDPLKRRILPSDFRQVAPGIWLPYNVMMEIYGEVNTRPNQVVASLEAQVESIELDVPESWFEANLPRGATVMDIDNGGSRVVGEELATLDRNIKRLSLVGPVFRPKRFWETGWFQLVTSLLIVSGIAVFVLRFLNRN